MTENTQATATQEARGFRRKIVGTVTSDKMDKTVVVECVSRKRDALYGKFVRTRKKFKAHDEKNEFKVGDLVDIEEHRPLSREKRFVVVRLVKAAPDTK